VGALLQDLRYAFRLLRRDPRFSLLAVLALALGTGATTAVFTVVNAVLLRPLPYAKPDRLVVALYGTAGSSPVSPADFLDYRREAQSFSAMAVAQVWSVTLSGGDRAERLDGLSVSGDLFPMLGVSPAIGRGFLTSEDQPGRNQVVLISDRLWRRRFAADPGIVGQTLDLNGLPYTVVGVMPAGFRFAPFWAPKAEVWAPIAIAGRAADRGGQSLRLFARLRDGVTVAQAQAEMSAICARLVREYPATNANLRITVQPLLEKVVSGIRPTLLVLMALVTCVMLMACANVANALLARATGRRQEIALRVAIGAGRAHIVRQLLTESVLLSALGAAAGLALAAWGVHAILAAIPPDGLPRQQDVTFDLRVFAMAWLATLAAGVATGLAPTVQLLRRDPVNPLRQSARGATEGGRMRVRNVLIAGEVALALVLLVGAGLLGRTMVRLNSVDPGFRIDHLAVASVSLQGTPSAAPEARQATFDRVRGALERLPSVTAVGAINHLPLAGDTWVLGYSIDGRASTAPGQGPRAIYRVIQPGYFSAMGLRLLRGRDISASDTAASTPVAVINQAMANRQFPGGDPIGRRIHLPGPGDMPDPVTIVGVSSNARQGDWTSEPDDEVYVAFAQRSGEFGLTTMTFVVRTSGDPAAVASAIPRVVSSVDRGLAVSDHTTMAAVVADQLWRERLTSALTGAFAVIALGLAAIGVYAVVGYAVARRTREFGVRMALGASRGHVRGLALSDAFGPVTAGIVAGLAVTVACARFMRALVFDVSVLDPVAIAGAATLLVIAAGAAAWLPARRASRLDPTVALRQE
jgi:putative ABC transport system permease protein